MAAGPWEKFQASSGPWSSYGSSQEATQNTEQQQPVTDPDSFRGYAEDFLHGLSSGVAGDVVGAGQLVRHMLPDSLTDWVANSQFGQRLSEEANRPSDTWAGSVGNFIGSSAPFMVTPGLGVVRGAGLVARTLKPAARVLTRSTLPAVSQPTDPNDPNYWGTKGLQAGLGTIAGETLQGIGRAAGVPVRKWTAADKKAEAAAAHNQRVQQAVDQLNQRNQRAYRGAQVQHEADVARQLDVPRQATQDVLNDARGLIGLRPLEYSLTRESAPQALRDVGNELDRVYRQMSFDPNQGGWLQNAQRIQQEVLSRLRQDPRAQALWAEVFNDKAFMPVFRAEAGRGTPTTGIAPATTRSPAGQSFRVRSPTGDVQGPLGTRSGPVSGEQLSRMMSVLTKAQQRFGLEAQRGGGGVYKDMADGLARMRQSIEQQLDVRFPKLAEQRRLANQAYFLTSRVMEAVDVHGTATPERLLQAFRDAEGDTRFGTDRRYADIKDRLERQHRTHTTKIEPPQMPTTIKGPAPVPVTPADPRLPHGAATAAAHLVPGGHVAHMAARHLMQRGARPILRQAERLQRAGPPAAVGAAQYESEPQELVVTPRGAYWQDQRRE